MLLCSPGRPGSLVDLEIGLRIGDPQQLRRDSALPEWYETALSQTQLFKRLIDRQNTRAISFPNITCAPVKPWEGREGLQFIQIFIYQFSIKLVLSKVADNLFIGVECIAHFCLSDLSFLWPGFYYLDNLFYFKEHQFLSINYKASFFKMLILPMGRDQHSHRLLWPNKGENKDLAHEVLHHQTEFLLLMKWPKSIKKFHFTPKSTLFSAVLYTLIKQQC